MRHFLMTCLTSSLNYKVLLHNEHMYNINTVYDRLQVRVTLAYLPADHKHNRPQQIISSHLLKQSEAKSQQQPGPRLMLLCSYRQRMIRVSKILLRNANERRKLVVFTLASQVCTKGRLPLSVLISLVIFSPRHCSPALALRQVSGGR